MKNTKLAKKGLSFLLSLVMVFSCLVFATPIQSNAASAGSYYVRVTYTVNNAVASGKVENYSMKLTWVDVNGTSGGSNSSQDLAITSTGSKTLTWTNIGFPTSLYAVANGKFNWGTDDGDFDITKIEIGPSTSYGYTLWAGKFHCESTVNEYNGTLSTGASFSSNNSSYATCSTSTNNWTKPYASAITLTNTANKTCPKSGSITSSVSSSAKDQFGVVMASSLSSISVSGSNKTTGISITNNKSGSDTLTISSSANLAGTTDSQTVTVTSSWSGSSTKTKTDTFTLSDCSSYIVTYKNYGGDTTFYTESGITYGHAAEGPTSEPTRASDTNNHYTFNGWSGSTSNITGDLTVNATFNSIAHSYEKTPIKEATCTESGTDKFTCSCGYSYSADSAALGHNKVAVDVAPTDQTPGYVYYECENGCGTVWAAEPNHETGTLEPATEPATSVDEVIENTDPIPAPSFNTFSDPSIGYDYSNRGAGLKLDDITYTDQNTVQNTRFTGSMLVPNGIDYSFASDKNSVTDFGFVYSQSELIEYDITNLEYGKNRVYKMSVSAQNSGVFTGDNWTGVSTHTSPDGTYLTFNLLIGIKAKNWTKDYCARAYITYNYMGFTYTVYDQDFSSRSVQYIAENVVQNESESDFARNYCQTKILDHLV